MAEVFASLDVQFQALAHKLRGSRGEHAGHQDQLAEFFESTERWLAFYEEVRALAARKQAEMRRQLVSSAEARERVAGSPGRAARVRQFPTWLSILMECYRIEQERCKEGGATGAGACPATPGSDTCSSDQPAIGLRLGHQSVQDAEPHGHRASLEASTTITAESATLPQGCQKLPDWKVVVDDSGAKTKQEATAAGGGTTRDKDVAAHGVESGIAAESSAPSSIDSLARFSRFLSLLVASAQEEQTPFTTERERAALAELLQASDDGSDFREFGFSLLDPPASSSRTDDYALIEDYNREERIELKKSIASCSEVASGKT
eukprot:g7499.t1